MKKLLLSNSTKIKKGILAILLCMIYVTVLFINSNSLKVQALPKNYTVYYYITKFTQSKASNYMTVDEIYWVSAINHDDDYYIVNKSKKLRTFKISSKAKFYIVETGDYFNPAKKVNYSEFKTHISNRFHAIINLKFSRKQVVEAKEIYTP